MNEYTSKFKNLSTYDLQEIIKNSRDFNKEAVEAAKFEIRARDVSKDIIQEIDNNLKKKDSRKSSGNRTTKVVLNKFSNTLFNLIDIFHPFQGTSFDPYKFINALSYGIGLYFILQVVNDFSLIKAMLSDIYSWDVSTFIYFTPYLTLLVSIILFNNHKKAGWILFSFYCVFSVIISISTLVSMVSYSYYSNDFLSV